MPLFVVNQNILQLFGIFCNLRLIFTFSNVGNAMSWPWSATCKLIY
jgi:hypothetical protein